MTTPSEWPFGPILKAARVRKGLSVRAAAELTGKAGDPGSISEATWRNLEKGTYRVRGQDFPYIARQATVAAAAAAVGLPLDHALKMAGLPALADQHPLYPGHVDLSRVPDGELLREVGARMGRGATPAPMAARPAPTAAEPEQDDYRLARRRVAAEGKGRAIARAGRELGEESQDVGGDEPA